MTAVIDTHLIEYLLIGAETYADEARALIAAANDSHAPALWQAKLANVLWMATRRATLTIEDAIERLSRRFHKCDHVCIPGLVGVEQTGTA